MNQNTEDIFLNDSEYVFTLKELALKAMKRGFLDIGVAMQMPNSSKWSFSISPTKLAEYLGIDITALNERLREMRGE